MGAGASVHDVFVETLRAGLALPTPEEAVTRAEVAALCRLYRMPPPSAGPGSS